MNTPDTTTTTGAASTAAPDPLTQAGEILRRFARGESITPGISQSMERSAATVISAVAYAQAVELRRIGDLLETLCDFACGEATAQDLVAIVAAQNAEPRRAGDVYGAEG